VKYSGVLWPYQSGGMTVYLSRQENFTLVTKTKELQQKYDTIADDYNNHIAIINAFHGTFYAKNMPIKRDSVLDIGCGTGDILKQLSKHFSKSYGIDPIKKFVTIAKQRASNSNIQVASGEHLPFKDNSMDYVISHAVFQHLDREVAISEIKRVLRQNGRVIIAEVLAKDALRKTSIHTFYKRMLFNYYLFTRYGYRRARKAKDYQASSDWKGLASIHRTRRLNFVQIQEFYSELLPGAKFKKLDSKLAAIIWDKS
jgi:ubiquinone/menaquinone biosynthesis C-methylase UbiE